VLELPTAQLLAQAPAEPIPRAPRAFRAESPRPRPRLERREPVVRESEPEEPDEQEPEPRVAQPGAMGTLRIQTRPWSNVFVDGRLVGTTPQQAISLSAGRHTVTLVNDDFGLRKTIKIDIESGETLTKVLTLTE
jgi:hypothetical protein